MTGSGQRTVVIRQVRVQDRLTCMHQLAVAIPLAARSHDLAFFFSGDPGRCAMRPAGSVGQARKALIVGITPTSPPAVEPQLKWFFIRMGDELALNIAGKLR